MLCFFYLLSITLPLQVIRQNVLKNRSLHDFLSYFVIYLEYRELCIDDVLVTFWVIDF